MDFKIKYLVQVDMDTNMFQREHFIKLIAQLRVTEDGDHLDKVDFRKSKLKNLDLSGLNLSNFDFSASALRNIDFSSSNLNGVTFEKAIVNSCKFTGASIEKCDFAHLQARDCDFSNATLQGHLRWMTMENCIFRNVKFGPMSMLASANFRTCLMENNTYGASIEYSGVIFPEGKSFP
ncbi:MAG: pentapeptide repeat-containing protein [Chitinophagales bacterium]